MDHELARLQKRVARLERTLRFALLGALVGVIAMAVTSSRLSAQPPIPPPSKVTAPFDVVDGKGKTLFRVQMSASGAGLGLFFDESGQEAAIVGRAAGADKPTFQVVSKGVLQAGLGMSDTGGGYSVVYGKTGVPAAEMRAGTSGNFGVMRVMSQGATRIELGIANQTEAGSMSLFSKSKAQTILVGDAGIRQTSSLGQPAAQFGADDNGQGYFMAANRAGSFLSKLSVASNGSSGRVEVSAGSEVKVLMGVLDNGKGDVCASGAPGKQACMSGLAIKALMPY